MPQFLSHGLGSNYHYLTFMDILTMHDYISHNSDCTGKNIKFNFFIMWPYVSPPPILTTNQGTIYFTVQAEDFMYICFMHLVFLIYVWKQRRLFSMSY